ncbi:uncharacterized protein LOC119653180 isoform X2 [Hermetia illucens]|uniref:uncharacterized protein LOC119653180 isoform X2 n=1 Tax=Hermetia illucens TaxID=343691 RepID=UPI0018CC5051|nr:uncharacterized protein LOC119653180 isoform X2 [Hermetia illucens]
MGHAISVPRFLKTKNVIISKQQLYAVQQCIQFLKENCNYTGIFINFGSQIKVRRIISKIRSGDENLLVFLKLSCTPRECASALSQFLHKIGKPLLPRRVQQLLIAENKGICSRTVALDALGLINDELEGTHLELFMAIMDLMKILSTVGSLRPTEVRVSHAPYLLMPLLFSTSDKLVKNWRSIADILNEMIICFDMYVQAPEIFQGIPSIPPVYQGQAMARSRIYSRL